jgi:2-oxoglutarate ferredoxin oxidoreductase subunit gamma
MAERLLIAGSGGQGIIVMGKIVATAAMRKVSHVTFFPSYGAEVRGGSANCQVIFSADEIASPVPECFDTMILMNEASLSRFLPSAAPECLLLINSSLCRQDTPQAASRIAATDLADELGDTRAANFVMLGAYLARKPLLDPQHVEDEIRQAFAGKPPGLIDLNVQALRTGLRCAG